MISENDEKVQLIICEIRTKWDMWDTTSFSKEDILRFSDLKILRMVSLLREEVHFFNNFLGTTKISTIFELSVYMHVVLLTNFTEHFELCFYFKYSRSYGVL